MKKAIIFDFDGLIVDTETVWYQAYKETLTELGMDLPLEEFSKVIGTDNDMLHLFIKAALGESVDLTKIESRVRLNFDAAMQKPVLRDGVLEYLQDAERLGLKIGLASSSSYEWVTGYLSLLNIRHYFSVIQTRETVAKVKPDPELYLLALRALNVEAAEAVAFEDSLNGLLAACAAGIDCVIVPNEVTSELAFNGHHSRLISMKEIPLSSVLSKFSN
jgi:putative hydrolase of the HAD superfamily